MPNLDNFAEVLAVKGIEISSHLRLLYYYLTNSNYTIIIISLCEIYEYMRDFLSNNKYIIYNLIFCLNF